VPIETCRVLDVHAAKDQLSAGPERMQVITRADPQGASVPEPKVRRRFAASAAGAKEGVAQGGAHR